MLITVISAVIVLFFFGFNGEGPLEASLTGVELGMRASKSLCAVLMVSGLTWGAEKFLDMETQTIQSGEKNTNHRFASNGTCPAYVNDHIVSTILGNPSTAFWYSTMQTPAPYINLQGIPLIHTTPDSRKVEVQASHDAPQDMIVFAIMIVFVGISVYLGFLGLYKISQLVFEGNQSQNHKQNQKQNSVGIHTLHLNRVDPVEPVSQAPTDSSIKDKLDAILNAMKTAPTDSSIKDKLDAILNAVRTAPTDSSIKDKLDAILNATKTAPTDSSIRNSLDLIWNDVKTILTRSEVRLGSGDLGNEHRNTLDTIRSAITSNRTTQLQATRRLSTRIENMQKKIGGRIQKSDSAMQRAFGEIRRLFGNFDGRYTTDQNANASRSEEVRTTLQNLDSQIQALNRNVEQLRARDQNSRITSMDANIERLIRFIDTRDSNDNIQTLNEWVKVLSNHMIEVLEVNIDKVSKSVKAIDPTKKIQAFSEILEQLRVQTSKALTVDSPHFTALNEQIMEVHKRVLGVPDGFIDLKHLTGELNQKVENLDKEMQRASNNYHTLESKIGDLQRDIHNSMARRNDVHDATQKIRDELQTIKDMSGEVKKMQKDISKLSSLGVDVRSMTEQLGNIQEDLQTIKPVPGQLQNMDEDIQDIKDEVQQKHDSIASKLDTYVQNLGERCTRKNIQEIKDEVRQKHDLIISKLEANRCICQNTLGVTQEEVPKLNNMSGEAQNLRKEIQEVRDEANRKHDSLASQLEANRCTCPNEPVKMQEESQTVNDTPERLLNLDKRIQEVEDDLKQKHDSLMSKLEANQCTCQNEPVKMQEASQMVDDNSGKLQELDNKVQEVEANLNQKHDSLVSQLGADRCTCQDTPDIPEEMSRMPGKVHDMGQDIKNLQGVQKGHTSKISKLEADLLNLDNRLTSQETREGEMKRANEEKLNRHEESLNRHETSLGTQSNGLSRLRIDLDNIKDENRNIPTDPQQEISDKERIAEDFAEWEKKIEEKLTSLRQALDSFESARANTGVQLKGVDERVKGLEDQIQKTKDALFEGFRAVIRTNLGGEGQQEIRDRNLEVLARKFKQGGLAYGMRQLLERLERGSNTKLAVLEKKVQSVFEQLDTFQTELMPLSQAGSQNTALDQPAIQQTGAVTDQMNVGSQSTTIQPEYKSSVPAQQSTTTTNENVVQQTPAPIRSNAPPVPRSGLIFQRRLSGSDEVPPDMQAILKAPAPGSHSHTYQANQPNTLTQTSPVQEYPPVLQTATTTGASHQASPPDQPHARDSAVTQPDASLPTASEAQTTESQDRPANTAGRKIKVPMSRKKSYQKQQQQHQSQQPPTTGFTVFPQQPQSGQQDHQQHQQQPQQSPTTDFAFFPQQQRQQQQQQQQQNSTEQNEQTQQPLTLEDIIDETQLVDLTTTEPTFQETTAQPPSPPPSPPQIAPEAQAALEAEAAERAQSQMGYDPLYDDSDYFDDEEINKEINEALDAEERKMEESRGNHPLSLPPTAQAADVPQNSQAAAQGSSQKKGESTNQQRGTVPEVQSNVAPPAKISKPIETSEEQKKAQEATKPKPASSSSQRPSLSQSRWADDEPTDPAPEDKRSGLVKDSGAQKKAEETVKQQKKSTTTSHSAPKQAKQTDKKPQGDTTGSPAKSSEEQEKADNRDSGQKDLRPLRPQAPDFKYSGPKHADKVAQGNTTSKPATTSGDQSYWTSTLPPMRPLPKHYHYPGPKEAFKVPQGATTSNPATPTPARPTRPSSSPFLGQLTNRSQLTDKLRAQGKDDGSPEKEAASDSYIEDPADREFRHQAVVEAFGKIKGKSMYESRWADPKPEAEKESSKKEKAPGSVEKSLATPAKKKGEAPSDDTTSSTVEEPDEQERLRATQEFFQTYKGTPLSKSRWADQDDEKEEPSKKEKPLEAVEKKPSTEESLVTPAKQNTKAPSGHLASTPIKRDDRPIRGRVGEEYKPTPLSASKRADETDEQETAPTPKSEARGSPAVPTDSKGSAKEKAVGDEQLGTPDKWNAWASTHGVTSSPADRAGGKSHSKAKGKEDLGGKNQPGTPDKWDTRASTTGEAKSSPAGASNKGPSLSESRWATKDDEKEGSASTSRSEAGRSPFRGSRGKYQVCDVDLKHHPKEEYVMKFDRIKGEEEDVAAENNVTSPSAEGVGARNEPISEEQHDTVVEDESDPFADVEEEVVFLDQD